MIKNKFSKTYTERKYKLNSMTKLIKSIGFLIESAAIAKMIVLITVFVKGCWNLFN